MKNWILINHDEHNVTHFETEQEAVKASVKAISDACDHGEGTWPSDMESYFTIAKITQRLEMYNKVTREVADESELDMIEGEGWEYICQWRMKEVA